MPGSKDRKDGVGLMGVPIESQAEEADHALPPGIELAGRMRIGVDDGGSRAHALQTDGFPHQDHFRVDSGSHDEQIARLSVVDRRAGSIRSWRR